MAAQNGIWAGVSRKAFGLGVALRTIWGGLLTGLPSRQRSSVRLPAPAPLERLVGQQRVAPLATEVTPGRQCANCRTSAQRKPGLWYRLGDRTYCQDCAQQQARKLRVALAGPDNGSPAKRPSIPPLSLARQTVLKPTQVKLGAMGSLEGYAVYAGGKDIWLSLTPEFKVEAGQRRVDKSRWFVTYNRAGRPIGGPFTSVKEAHGLAALLAHLDWNRPLEAFDDTEIQEVVRVGNRYRESIEMRSR